MGYVYKLDNGILIDNILKWWKVSIPEKSNLWKLPSPQLTKALNEAKKLIPYAKELQEVDMNLDDNWESKFQLAPHTVMHVEEVLSELKNVENNPLADKDTKESARNILQQYARYHTRKGLQRKTQSTIRNEVILRDNRICQYCGKKLDKKGIHIDHVIPYSLGGRTELDNLVVACAECNLKKSGRTLAQVNMKIMKQNLNERMI